MYLMPPNQLRNIWNDILLKYYLFDVMTNIQVW